MKYSNTSYRAVSILFIVASSFMIFTNLQEWYIVGILESIEDYPFGGEGPVPYYYKSANLYSTVNLVWGISYSISLLFGIWFIIKKQFRSLLIIFGVVLLFIILGFIQSAF
jgi:hypothetical protein